MPAAEFAERFFGIFAAVPQQTADELFLQMALVLPTPEKRLALLRHAQNVSTLMSAQPVCDCLCCVACAAHIRSAPGAAAACTERE